MNAPPDGREITKAEAEAALNEIDRVIIQTRKAIAQGCAAPMLVLWGVIWVIGYGSSEFAPSAAPLIWLILGAVGGGASWLVGWYFRSPVKSPRDSRMGWFWVVLFIYAGIWMWLLSLSTMGPDHPQADAVTLTRRFGAYWATIPMFAYVVGGLWLGRFFVWLGLIVTALTITGFCMLPAHFSLWMAFTGGGALIISGLFIRKFWR